MGAGAGWNFGGGHTCHEPVGQGPSGPDHPNHEETASAIRQAVYTRHAEGDDGVRRTPLRRNREKLLTGDNGSTARAVAGELKVDEWRADQLPEHKAEEFESFRQQYGNGAMVGDTGTSLGVTGNALRLAQVWPDSADRPGSHQGRPG